MKPKRLLAAALLLLCLVLVAATVAFLLVDNETLVRMIAERVESASGTHITYRDDAAITRSLAPTLSINDLVVADNDRLYQLRTASLQLQISLPGLLFGDLDILRLILGETDIAIRKADAGESTRTAGFDLSTLPLRPVLRDVQVASVSIAVNGKKYMLPAGHLRELTLGPRPEGSGLELSGAVELLEETVSLVAQTPDVHQVLGTRQLPFSISARTPGVNLEATGSVDFNAYPSTIEAMIHGQIADLKRTMSGVLDLAVPGTLTISAMVTGTLDRPAVEKLSADWKGPGRSAAELKGRIADAIGLEEIEISLSGKLDTPAWLSPLLPADMGTLKSAELSAEVSGSYRQLRIHEGSLNAQTGDGLGLSLAGGFDLSQGSTGPEPENIDLRLVFTAPATRAARVLLFEQVPEFGLINGKADIHSQSGDPSLEGIVVQTRDAEGLELDLRGRIARFPLHPDRPNSGYDMECVVKARTVSILAERLGGSLSLQGPLDLRFRIEGDTRALELKKIALSAGEKATLQVAANGGLSFGDWSQADPIKAVDLELQARSRTTRVVGDLTGQRLPEMGALTADARLHTVSGRHRIDDLRILTQKNEPLRASLTGSAEHVALFPRPAANGIQLKAEGAAADTARLNAVFGLPDRIPAIGPLSASARIAGTDRELSVSDLSIRAGTKDVLELLAEGRLGHLGPANQWRPEGTEISIKARSDSSSSLTRALGYRVPELGRISGQASIKDKDKTLGLEAAVTLVGKAGTPVAEASGSIDDLFGAGRTRFDVKLNLDGHTLAAFADKQQLPELGPLAGSMSISNSDGTLGIDSLHLESRDSQLLNLAVDGRFGDFGHLDTLALDGRLRAKDLQLIGALFDQDWPAIGPVRIDTQVRRTGGRTGLDTRLSAGELGIHAAIDCTLDAVPMHFGGKITAENFFLPDLVGRMAEREKKKGSKQEKNEVFSRAPMDFDWLKKADLDLSVAIESFDQERSQLESAQLAIVLKSGHLAISPANLVYPEGALRLDLQFDTQNALQVDLRAFGENINPWRALAVQESAAGGDFKGDLDIDVELASSGNSEHELASNLQGDVYLTVRDGRIRKSLLDLVFVDLVGWTVSKAVREKYVRTNCGIADYSIRKGVVTTNAFLLDTEGITVGGHGTIDLGNEQIDYVFLPKKKSRLILKADPVKVTGPLDNPSIALIPWKSAVTTYGGLIFAPYVFVGVVAADYLSGMLKMGTGMLKMGSTESPCLQYEKLHKKKTADAATPGKP
jgi:hypothetical protein